MRPLYRETGKEGIFMLSLENPKKMPGRNCYFFYLLIY